MAAIPKPERPWKVTLAVWLLYLSLGITVIRIFVPWVFLGQPGEAGVLVVILVKILAALYFPHQQFLQQLWGVPDILAVLIAVCFYCMIGMGKNWARISLLGGC